MACFYENRKQVVSDSEWKTILMKIKRSENYFEVIEKGRQLQKKEIQKEVKIFDRSIDNNFMT